MRSLMATKMHELVGPKKKLSRPKPPLMPTNAVIYLDAVVMGHSVLLCKALHITAINHYWLASVERQVNRVKLLLRNH